MGTGKLAIAGDGGGGSVVADGAPGLRSWADALPAAAARASCPNPRRVSFGCLVMADDFTPSGCGVMTSRLFRSGADLILDREGSRATEREEPRPPSARARMRLHATRGPQAMYAIDR
jgi:hypothetical protein